nr:ribosomal protein L22 [Passiflora tripartita var. mollissima]
MNECCLLTRGPGSTIKRLTCHINIVLKDISLYLYEEYKICLKLRISKKKSTNMTFHDIYYSNGRLWHKK